MGLLILNPSQTLSDLSRVAETHELKCKLALGQGGKGEITWDF